MPSVLMINPTNVVGGVERPIENYLSCLDQSRFSAAYAVTPFDGDEEHLSRIRATGAKVVDLSPVCSVKKAGLEISGGSFRQADTNGLKPFLVGLWKAAMPACWDEWQYHVRQHRCLRPRFRRALAQASVMPDVVHLLGAHGIGGWQHAFRSAGCCSPGRP